MIHKQLTFLTYILKTLAYVDVGIVTDDGKSYRKQDGMESLPGDLAPGLQDKCRHTQPSGWLAGSLLSLSFTRQKGQLFEVDLIHIIPMVLFIFIISRK